MIKSVKKLFDRGGRVFSAPMVSATTKHYRQNVYNQNLQSDAIKRCNEPLCQTYIIFIFLMVRSLIVIKKCQ